MTLSLFYLCVGITLWLLGLHGMLRQSHVLRRIIAVNIMGGGAFTVMVALAIRSDPVDPVLQALVVTGLVVAVSATAFALRLASAEAAAQQEEKLKEPPK
jgi:multicomponent Na+:H+ antiporter subunit C